MILKIIGKFLVDAHMINRQNKCVAFSSIRTLAASAFVFFSLVYFVCMKFAIINHVGLFIFIAG